MNRWAAETGRHRTTKNSVYMAGIGAQIQIRHPYDTNLNLYPFTKILGCQCVHKAVVINEQFRHSSIIY